MKLGVKEIPDRGGILTLDSEPAKVKMLLRQSTSSPTRIKGTFIVANAVASEGDGVKIEVLQLPFAQAVIGDGEHIPCGFTPEFRLEMN